MKLEGWVLRINLGNFTVRRSDGQTEDVDVLVVRDFRNFHSRPETFGCKDQGQRGRRRTEGSWLENDSILSNKRCPEISEFIRQRVRV